MEIYRETMVSDGCGHTVLGRESGILSSKNYPGTYPNNTWCEVKLRVPEGNSIVLKFGDLDIEAKECESDYTSVLCKAAVHAGVILDEVGGAISVEEHKGLSHYSATRANGIQSKDASSWRGGESGRLREASPNNTQPDSKGRPWTPEHNNSEQWLQLDLGEKKKITEIVTTGSTLLDLDYYVQSYKIQHKERNRWKTYTHYNSSNDMVFEGNVDCLHSSRNTFQPPIVARYLRVIPQTWNQRIAMTVELLGYPYVKGQGCLPHPPHMTKTHRSGRKSSGPSSELEAWGLTSKHLWLSLKVLSVNDQDLNTAVSKGVSQSSRPKSPLPLSLPTVDLSSPIPETVKPRMYTPGVEEDPEMNTPVASQADLVKLAIIIVPTVVLSLLLLLVGVCVFKALQKKKTKETPYGSSDAQETGKQQKLLRLLNLRESLGTPPTVLRRGSCWKQIKQPFSRHQSTEFTISYSSEKDPIQKLDLVTSTMAEYQQPLMIGMGTVTRKGSTFRPMDTETKDEPNEAATHYDYLHNTANQYALPLTNQEPEYATPIIERHTFRKEGFLPDPSYSVPGVVLSKTPSFKAMDYRKAGALPGVYQTPQPKTERVNNSEGVYDCPKVNTSLVQNGTSGDYQRPQVKPSVMESYSTPRDCVKAGGALTPRLEPEGTMART
ncbi:hypothetical protein JZ751_005073 [Albula glossodonta]|uniref:Uncharacterized protein n=1 Tax=Albula glossodonta TaxID=121402 RepID=A0A8T2P762_9TELE|nr:hypothetical protein JZ751_005073 [Albula glossodonta]